MFVIREEQMDAFSRPIQHCSEESVDETETAQEEYLHIKILYGADDKYANKAVKQYVNLPQDEKWLETSIDKSPVKNFDRLGRVVRVKVRFTTDKKGYNLINDKRKFKINIIGKNGNVTYLSGEKQRSKEYSNEEDTKKEKELHNASYCYGYKKNEGDNFTNEEEFQKNPFTAMSDPKYALRRKERKKFKDEKKLSYCDEEGELIDKDGWKKYKKENYENEWEKYKTDYQKDYDEWKKYYGNAKYQFTIDNLQTNEEGEKILYFRLTAAGGNRYYFFAETPDGIVKSDKSFEIETWRIIFYKKLTMTDAAAAKDLSLFNATFERCNIEMKPVEPEIQLNNSNFNRLNDNNVNQFIISVYKNEYGNSNCSNYEPYIVVIAFVVSIDGSTMGWEFDGTLICVETKADTNNNEIQSDEIQNSILIHEMGHKIGMVPDGSDLDEGKYHYTNKGHVGGHCGRIKKSRKNTDFISKRELESIEDMTKYPSYSYTHKTTIKIPVCVMFGGGGYFYEYYYGPSGGSIKKEKKSVKKFCASCSEAVKKIDLSEGWKSF